MAKRRDPLEPLAWEVADFARQHCPEGRAWRRGKFRQWMHRHLADGDVVCVRDDQRRRRLVGVMVAYPVMSVADVARDGSLVRDPEGPVLFVTLAVACAPLVLRALTVMMVRRFGRRPSVAFYPRRSGSLRVHPTPVLLSAVRRHSHHHSPQPV